MFRFKLRTLPIVLVIGPPVLGETWFVTQRLIAEQHKRQERKVLMASIRAAQRRADMTRAMFSCSPTLSGSRLVPKQPADNHSLEAD